LLTTNLDATIDYVFYCIGLYLCLTAGHGVIFGVKFNKVSV